MPGQPSIFTPGLSPLGAPRFTIPAPPRLGDVKAITGTTRDSTGVALAGVTVRLVRTADNSVVDQQVSDASGVYRFISANGSDLYYIEAYKAGSPDVAGTTVNTLVGA